MKRIAIKVIPNANRNLVSEDGDRITVYVKAPPFGGKANKAVINVLAKYFNLNTKEVRIIRGEKSRKKLVEIGAGNSSKT